LSIFELPNILKNFLNIGIFQFAGMLLQLLAIPLITRKYGLEIFGEIALTTSVAYLLGNFVNYGTNQTAIKDVAIAKSNSTELSKIFSKVFWLRFVVFLIIIVMTTMITMTTQKKGLLLWLSITPLIFSELINPLYFLIGIEKIHWISWGNLCTRLLSLLLIFSVPLHNNTAIYLNLFVGVPLFLFYFIVTLYVIIKSKLKFLAPDHGSLTSDLKNNFFVTFNGNSALMQQSIFLFFVAGLSNPLLLGAYGIIDKLLSATRQIVSSFSLSIYPRAAELYHKEKLQWRLFRKKIQQSYALVFLIAGIFIYACAHPITNILTSDQNQYSIGFVQLFALAPLFLSLNANNVIDLLLGNKYKEMFYISLMVLFATLFLSYTLTRFNHAMSIGLYPVLIEGTCFLIYTAFIRKLNLHAA
jgi:O-antigen/teichoic acid export membrane protein